MSSNDILFGAASIATIFWTAEGFTPSSKNGVVDVGTSLVKHLDEKDVINGIIKMMPPETESSIKGQLVLNFCDTCNNEYIEIIDLHNIQYELYNLKRFTSRINLCNKEENRRAKIVMLMDLDFRDTPLNAKKMVETMDVFLLFQEAVGRFIYKNIPSEFMLGDVIYESNIISVESDDKELETIIDSMYDIKAKKFIKKPKYKDMTDRKLLDAYYVLLSHGDLISKDMTEKLMEAEFVEHNVKQSNMVFHQENGGKVPSKTLNFEIEEGHRRITNLTKSYSAPLVTKRLSKDYLNLT